MEQSTPVVPTTGIDEFVKTTIQQYRAKLLDLSSRNPLVNFRHSERSRSHIRVIDEIPEKLFERLETSRQMWFDPLPDPVLIPPDEETALFQGALRQATQTDEKYKKAIDELGPASSERKRQKADRELRSRVRAQLGLAPYDPTTDPKRRAVEAGISTDYDLPKSNGQNRRRHTDNNIQTLYFRDDLDRKLSALRESARSLLQDAGLSALFCAFGFLEYYESETSDAKRIAPLVFYPVELDRELQNGEYRYFVVGKNEEVEINVALRELLKREYSIELPEWKQDDTEVDSLGTFLAKMESVIRSRKDWKVRRYVTAGLFTFSTLVMYKDLDPEKWPQDMPLHRQPVLRTLIAGAEVHGSSFAPDYVIDQLGEPDALLITDADSSQHSAVIDVLKGKNTVIQGPPGTGKSQTITNIISAALYAGKSILFVAEKMAALEVVKKRLDLAGLGPFCLEVHSSKTSKTSIVQSLAARLEHQPRRARPLTVQNNLEAIGKARKELIYYVEKTNEAAGRTGLTVRDVLLGSAMRESARPLLPDAVSMARFADALGLTPHVRKEMNDAAANLERQLAPIKEFGCLAEHPWRGLQNCGLTDLEVDALLNALRLASGRIIELLNATATLEEQTGAKFESTLEQVLLLTTSVLNLTQPSEQVHRQSFSRLGAQQDRELAARLVSSMKSIADSEGQLRMYVGELDASLLHGSSTTQAVLDTVARLEISDLTITQVEAQMVDLEDRKKQLNACLRVALEVANTFGLANREFRGLRAAWIAIQQLQKLPRELWVARSLSIVKEANRAVIKKAANTCAELIGRRNNLEKEWERSLIPSASELKAHVIALRSTNWFAALFSPQCRAARSLFKVANRSVNRKFNRELLAQEYSMWAQLQEEELRFTSNHEFAAAMGGVFSGLETDFATVERICDWAEESRTALGVFGATGQELCRQLLERPSEELCVCSSTTENAGFQEFTAVVLDRQADVSQTFERMLGELELRCSELDSVLSSVALLTFSAQRPLSELGALVKVLATIESQQKLVLQQRAELGLSDPDLEHLKDALDFAEAIAAAKLPVALKRWLYLDVSNLELLRSQCAPVAARLIEVEASVEAADHIAKFDWQLWSQSKDAASADLGRLRERFTRAIEYASRLQDYLNVLLAETAASDSGIGPVLAGFVNVQQDYHDLVIAVEFAFYRSAAEQLLGEDPKLRRHSGSSHDQLRAQYQGLDKEFISLRRQLLAAKVSDREVPQGIYQGRVGDLTELALVQHVAGKIRPRLSLRDLFRRAGEAIKALSPCWMMSPMSVAQFLEPGQIHFDLVVMDEASQIRPEEALGAIARGGQIVVVGDQMQLPPTSFFQRLSADGGSVDDEELEDVQQESVLEAAASRFYPPRMLKWHYRSEHGSLISFSNHEFYGDDLTVFPSPYHDHPEYGVKLNQVDGVYGAGVNEQEARAVVDEASKFMSLHPNHSLGIVAVNSKQAELIRELVDQLCASDPDAEAYRAKWSVGLDSLFVKNLENVQGDERDVIFVSTVYGKDQSGNFYQRFGPINSAYGHRRLNVLFTRAKKKVVVFSSMKPEEIQDDGKSWGVRALKGYLQFARTGSWILPTSSDVECDSEFEEWVLRALRSAGYEAVPQLGFAGYRLDLAVRDPKQPGTFLCGIECDGATYHSARSVRERDRLRQEVLERLGWNIYRIWSTDWFRNPTLQTRNLVAYLKRLAAL